KERSAGDSPCTLASDVPPGLSSASPLGYRHCERRRPPLTRAAPAEREGCHFDLPPAGNPVLLSGRATGGIALRPGWQPLRRDDGRRPGTRQARAQTLL